jgi:hypothetical protein
MKWIKFSEQKPELVQDDQVYLITDGFSISTSIWVDNGNGYDWEDTTPDKLALHFCRGSVEILNIRSVEYWMPLYMPKIHYMKTNCDLSHSHIYQA